MMRRSDRLPLPYLGPHARRAAQALVGSLIVSEPFSVLQSRCAPLDSSLFDDIRARTGSDAATSGILRSIERFGSDPSIVRYEVSPRASIRFGVATPVAWTVRAVRS